MKFVYVPSRYSGSGYKYFSFLRQEYGGVELLLGNLKQDLKVIRPDLVFVQGDWMQTYKVPLNLGIPYVLVEHDVMSLRTKLSNVELANEERMITCARAVIFTSEDHADYVTSKYVNCPEHRVIHLKPLLKDVNFKRNDKKLRGKHLVYAGGIQLEKSRHARYGYRSYHEVFKSFIDVGWTVHLYPNNRNKTARFDYKDLGCELHHPLPYNELLREIGIYTAGLLGYAKNGVPSQAFDYTQKCRPNKNWDYLAAGIPTIAVNAGNAANEAVKGGWGIRADLGNGGLKNIHKRLPEITDKMRFSQVMDLSKKKFDEIIMIGLTKKRSNERIEIIEKVKGGKIVINNSDKWFITKDRVIDPKTGRLLYGRNRRIPYKEAVRLGLVEKVKVKKPAPTENKVIVPTENKAVVPKEVIIPKKDEKKEEELPNVQVDPAKMEHLEIGAQLKKEIYYCGSLTQAGKPCRIRVKNKGDKCKRHDMGFVREGESRLADK